MATLSTPVEVEEAILVLTGVPPNRRHLCTVVGPTPCLPAPRAVLHTSGNKGALKIFLLPLEPRVRRLT